VVPAELIMIPTTPRIEKGRDPTPSPSGKLPFAFQVVSPFSATTLLFPYALVLHVNPRSLSIQETRKIDRMQTRGGYVEQHWGTDLTQISAEGTTGAFINLRHGLSSLHRRDTIAHSRMRDLLDLYHHNGSLYGPSGSILFKGQVQIVFDRGVYNGGFRSFDVSESAESPFQFTLSWTFKVESTVYELGSPNALPPPPPQLEQPQLAVPGNPETRIA
jgi:hypothetical protein